MNMTRREVLSAGLTVTGAAIIPFVAYAKDKGNEILVSGHCPPEFSKVRKAFKNNFEKLGELGADVCVYIEGKEILHLYGGYADYNRTKAWMRDTLGIPASAVKGMFPFCVHKLVDDGIVRYDDKITKYWPEFGQEGKDKTTIRHLVSHHAGLEKTFPIDVYKSPLEKILPVMEKAKPSSPPGTKGAYHSQTHMPLLAALVWKITRTEIKDYFRKEIAGPWGIDAYFTLPESEKIRGADYVIPVKSSYHKWLIKSGMVEGKPDKDVVLAPNSGHLSPYVNGRGFARLYGAVANGGILDDVRLFSEETVCNMGTEQWMSEGIASQSSSGGELRATMGWFKAGGAFTMGPNPNTFGMPGAGGNLGMADPDLKMGFGYTLNSWHTFGTGLGPRLKGLLDAVYASV